MNIKKLDLKHDALAAAACLLLVLSLVFFYHYKNTFYTIPDIYDYLDESIHTVRKMKSDGVYDALVWRFFNKGFKPTIAAWLFIPPLYFDIPAIQTIKIVSLLLSAGLVVYIFLCFRLFLNRKKSILGTLIICTFGQIFSELAIADNYLVALMASAALFFHAYRLFVLRKNLEYPFVILFGLLLLLSRPFEAIAILLPTMLTFFYFEKKHLSQMIKAILPICVLAAIWWASDMSSVNRYFQSTAFYSKYFSTQKIFDFLCSENFFILYPLSLFVLPTLALISLKKEILLRNKYYLLTLTTAMALLIFSFFKHYWTANSYTLVNITILFISLKILLEVKKIKISIACLLGIFLFQIFFVYIQISNKITSQKSFLNLNAITIVRTSRGLETVIPWIQNRLPDTSKDFHLFIVFNNTTKTMHTANWPKVLTQAIQIPLLEKFSQAGVYKIKSDDGNFDVKYAHKFQENYYLFVDSENRMMNVFVENIKKHYSNKISNLGETSIPKDDFSPWSELNLRLMKNFSL